MNTEALSKANRAPTFPRQGRITRPRNGRSVFQAVIIKNRNIKSIIFQTRGGRLSPEFSGLSRWNAGKKRWTSTGISNPRPFYPLEVWHTAPSIIYSALYETFFNGRKLNTRQLFLNLMELIRRGRRKSSHEKEIKRLFQ